MWVSRCSSRIWRRSNAKDAWSKVANGEGAWRPKKRKGTAGRPSRKKSAKLEDGGYQLCSHLLVLCPQPHLSAICMRKPCPAPRCVSLYSRSFWLLCQCISQSSLTCHVDGQHNLDSCPVPNAACQRQSPPHHTCPPYKRVVNPPCCYLAVLLDGF